MMENNCYKRDVYNCISVVYFPKVVVPATTMMMMMMKRCDDDGDMPIFYKTKIHIYIYINIYPVMC